MADLTPDQERLLLEGLTGIRAAFDMLAEMVRGLERRVEALEQAAKPPEGYGWLYVDPRFAHAMRESMRKDEC